MVYYHGLQLASGSSETGLKRIVYHLDNKYNAMAQRSHSDREVPCLILGRHIQGSLKGS